MNGIILLPSLNRVSLLERFFKSYVANESELPGLLLVDKADFERNSVGYNALALPRGWKLVKTDGVSMAEKCQEVWDRFINLDFVVLLNDDHIIKTKHWDKRIASQINGHNIVSTNDNWQAPARIAGATAWSCRILRTIGYMFPPGAKHLFIDTMWEFLGGKAQCVQIMMDVMVEHDHAFKHGEKDSTHHQVYPDGWMEGPDAKAYERWMREDAQKDLQKLIDLQPRQGLMIATPSHDGDCSLDYALGLSDLAIFFTQQNVYFEMARVVGSSLIPHARNTLVDMFLKSKCQKLLFMDADQGFNKDVVLSLFQSNRRIIAGVTPHKRFPINLNFDPLEEDKKYFQDLNNKSVSEFVNFCNAKADKVSQEIEVEKVGTGCLMIDRSVFEILKPEVQNYSPFDNSDHQPHYEYFKMGAFDGKYRGEDWYFIQLAKKLHIPIFIHPRALLSHKGQYSWNVA